MVLSTALHSRLWASNFLLNNLQLWWHLPPTIGVFTWLCLKCSQNAVGIQMVGTRVAETCLPGWYLAGRGGGFGCKRNDRPLLSKIVGQCWATYYAFCNEQDSPQPYRFIWASKVKNILRLLDASVRDMIPAFFSLLKILSVLLGFSCSVALEHVWGEHPVVNWWRRRTQPIVSISWTVPEQCKNEGSWVHLSF